MVHFKVGWARKVGWHVKCCKQFYRPAIDCSLWGSMTPLLGLTQYCFWAVVFTLKMTVLFVGFFSFNSDITTSEKGPREDGGRVAGYSCIADFRICHWLKFASSCMYNVNVCANEHSQHVHLAVCKTHDLLPYAFTIRKIGSGVSLGRVARSQLQLHSLVSFSGAPNMSKNCALTHFT